jgi:hypothetical protein
MIQIPSFAPTVSSKIRMVQFDLDEYPSGPSKEQGKMKEVVTMVFEVDVAEGVCSVDVVWVYLMFDEKSDMLNGGGNLHGGCSGFLIGELDSVLLLEPSPKSNTAFRQVCVLSLFDSEILLNCLSQVARRLFSLGTRMQMANTAVQE